MEITNQKIIIVSGEGQIGSIEIFKGKKTKKAINRKLNQERCGGDRWAKVYQYLHDTSEESVWKNLENNELKLFNKCINERLNLLY